MTRSEHRRDHLAEAEKLAKRDQETARERFQDWAASKVDGARHMNPGSGAQIRQLLFAGTLNAKQTVDRKGNISGPENRLEFSRVFKVRPEADVDWRNVCLWEVGAERWVGDCYFGPKRQPSGIAWKLCWEEGGVSKSALRWNEQHWMTACVPSMHTLMAAELLKAASTPPLKTVSWGRRCRTRRVS